MNTTATKETFVEEVVVKNILEQIIPDMSITELFGNADKIRLTRDGLTNGSNGHGLAGCFGNGLGCYYAYQNTDGKTVKVHADLNFNNAEEFDAIRIVETITLYPKSENIFIVAINEDENDDWKYEVTKQSNDLILHNV